MERQLREGQVSLVRVDVKKAIDSQLEIIRNAGLIPTVISLSDIFMFCLKRQVMQENKMPDTSDWAVENFNLTSYQGLPLHNGGPERYYKNRVTGTEVGRGLTLPLCIVYELPPVTQEQEPEQVEEHQTPIPSAEQGGQVATELASETVNQQPEESAEDNSQPQSDMEDDSNFTNNLEAQTEQEGVNLEELHPEQLNGIPTREDEELMNESVNFENAPEDDEQQS